MRKQCQLLGVNRSSLYREPCQEDTKNLLYMRLLDEQYTEDPSYGVLRMTHHLRSLGHEVNPKRVRRLLRLMSLDAVYQKPNTSQAKPEHKVFPYLLRGVTAAYPDHIWSTDITYLRLSRGFAYLMAVIDWHSRYVLDWDLSPTLDADFCIETVGRLLQHKRCEIFNSDQGSQFTSPRFTAPLLAHGIRISMDGRGRALDNIFVERLWRTVKYEYVYLQDWATLQDARSGLAYFFDRYNHRRLHQSLGYQTPASVYFCARAGSLKACSATLHKPLGCSAQRYFQQQGFILNLVYFGLDNGEYLMRRDHEQ